MTITQWFGWCTLIVVWLMGMVSFVVADDWETWVDFNSLRHCLNADRQVRLGRRSVIASPQVS
ncbi:MAG: hypothetical protein ACRDRX_24395 [Pseudonocardiaceae bacterium]